MNCAILDHEPLRLISAQSFKMKDPQPAVHSATLSVKKHKGNEASGD